MKILVLAGGFDQIALIKELKKRSHEVILADYYETPPAKEYADKHYQVSTLDEEKILEIAKRENVDLVTTACTDQALLTMAKVSEELKLPSYISYETALNVTNKLYMKDIFIKNGIPTSKYKIIKNIGEIEKMDISYPLVVKPCDCNSSKGVRKVLNKDELLVSLEKCLELSRTSSAIVEEYKEGIELSIDVFVENANVKILSITQTQKIKNNKDSFTICKSSYSTDMINNSQKQKIYEIAEKISKAFNLKNSPILIQAIMNEKEINVLEFSARMGGGSKYRLIEVLSGVNVMEQYVNLILNEKVIIEPKEMVKYAELNYCYCRNGKIKELDGFEELKKEGKILDYFQYKTKGMEITQALNSGDRAAGYLIVSNTKKELEKARKNVNESIKIYDEKNNNIYMCDYEVK